MTPIASATASTLAMPASTDDVAGQPCGHSTCHAKNTARFTITPTTAAVMPLSGAVNRSWPCVDSISGAPARMNKKLGRNVKNVATVAPAMPASASDSAPNTCRVQPPTKPTNATTMISGPGVDSPSARPSIICGGVSQPYVSTAPWYTYGSTAYAPPNVSIAAFVKNQAICASGACQPYRPTSVAITTSHNTAQATTTRSSREARKRACAGVGVVSSMTADGCSSC